MSLKRVASVTGGSSGIGLAIVKRLQVFLLHHPPCALLLIVSCRAVCVQSLGSLSSHACSQRLGYAAVSWDIQAPADASVPYIRCDVSSETNVAAALSETVDKHGASPSILINNCGLQYMAPVTEFPLERWNTLLGIMVTGTFLCSKAVLPGDIVLRAFQSSLSLLSHIPHSGMQQQGWGRIVNISSIHGKEASPFKSACVPHVSFAHFLFLPDMQLQLCDLKARRARIVKGHGS